MIQLLLLLFLIVGHAANIFDDDGGGVANKCFADLDELKAAVDEYIEGDCGNLFSKCNVTQMYGTPNGTWCVGKVTNVITAMEAMINSAAFSNQDLCQCGDDFQYINYLMNYFDGIFANSGCNFQDNPRRISEVFFVLQIAQEIHLTCLQEIHRAPQQ